MKQLICIVVAAISVACSTASPTPLNPKLIVSGINPWEIGKSEQRLQVTAVNFPNEFIRFNLGSVLPKGTQFVYTDGVAYFHCVATCSDAAVGSYPIKITASTASGTKVDKTFTLGVTR